MPANQRSVLSLSLPPDMAREYRALAKARGASASELFREIYADWRREHLRDDFKKLQAYGVNRAATAGLSEKDVERLVFGIR
jgi:hypothetical protein